MIRAVEADRPAIEAALGARPERAMFPLANLRAHGMAGGHDRAMSFWMDARPPAALLGLSDEGMAMPVWPDGLDAAALAPALAGRALIGCVGPAGAARALMRAAGLGRAPCRLDADEPQFALDLDALIVPPGGGMLTPLAADRARAVRWRMAYEAGTRTGGADPAAAARAVDGWIEAGSHRFLAIDCEPVAMTGFNAALPDIVQVGGVFVPPDLRGRGHARRAVALHLAEARAGGVRRATLFAASEAAVRAYVAIGFRRIGDYALVLFDGTVAA